MKQHTPPVLFKNQGSPRYERRLSAIMSQGDARRASLFQGEMQHSCLERDRKLLYLITRQPETNESNTAEEYNTTSKILNEHTCKTC